MTTPDPFVSGYRLTDGDQLNDALGNPMWSYSSAAVATPGGTVSTSNKIISALTNVATATALNAGLTLPQALPGAIFFIYNNAANIITIFAEGNSFINGIPGSVGITLYPGTAVFVNGLAAYQWQATLFGSTGLVNQPNEWTQTQTFDVAPIFKSLTGYVYANGTGAVTAATTIPVSALAGTGGGNLIPVTLLPLTNDQSRAALLYYQGTTGTSGTNWLSIVENDLNTNHNDTQDPITIRYYGAFWPPGQTAWNYVEAVLTAYFTWSPAVAAARIASVQNYALTNR